MTNNSVFEFNGLIPSSVFESREWQNCFLYLENEQSDFSRVESQFRSPEYRWPRAPLYNFSRCFEYPFVYYHLQRRASLSSGKRKPIVLDFGSGVTYFPFAVAKLGVDVCCVDVDPVVGVDIPKAARAISSSPGSVTAKVIDGSRLPYADNSVDGIYCISVLEHIPNFEKAVAEMCRVLRPGGVLLLTFDIRLSGNLGLTVSEKLVLDRYVEKMFDVVGPTRVVHPNDILDAFGGPYPYFPKGWKYFIYKTKQLLKPVFGKNPAPFFNIAVECKTLVKKES